jgi:hypothetical protein
MSKKYESNILTVDEFSEFCSIFEYMKICINRYNIEHLKDNYLDYDILTTETNYWCKKFSDCFASDDRFAMFLAGEYLVHDEIEGEFWIDLTIKMHTKRIAYEAYLNWHDKEAECQLLPIGYEPPEFYP